MCLPTGGSARFFSPLGTYDFLKRTTIIHAEKSALKALAPKITQLARLEGLGRSRAVSGSAIQVRQEKLWDGRQRSSGKPKKPRSASIWISTAAVKPTIETGMPFFNHMLDIFTRHGLFDIKIKAKGDLEVDYHHTVEDVGLALGQAFKEALGDKHGIRRFGEASCPLDETLGAKSSLI